MTNFVHPLIDTELNDAIIEIFNRNGQSVFTNKISFESGKYQITNDEGGRILKFTKVN